MLTPDSVLRVDEAGGKAIGTFKDLANKHYQGVALVDSNGTPIGTSASPISTALAGAGIQQRVETDPTLDVLAMTFDKWWNNKMVVAEMWNAGAILPVSSLAPGTGGLVQVASGGINSKAAVRTKFEVPQIPGLGMVFGFDILMTNLTTPVAGQKKRWGIGDQYNGIYLEWDGAGTLTAVCYNNAVLTATIASTAWNIPVVASGGGLLKDFQIQHWLFKFDWAQQRLILVLDGQQVLDWRPVTSAPLTDVIGGRMMVEVLSTAAMSSNYIQLVSMWCVRSGGSDRFSGLRRRRLHGIGIPIAASQNVCAFGMAFLPTVSISGQVVKNYRAARIRRIKIGAYPTTGSVTDSLYPMKVAILKNRQFTSAGIAKAIGEEPPTMNIWTGQSAMTVVATGTNASNAGYAAGNTVRYKIAAVGARGETIPFATLLAPVSVGTPAKSMAITFPMLPVPNAVAYKIYRQLNAAGNYVLIAWLDPILAHYDGFIDDGYLGHAASQPSVTEAAEHESFMYGYIWPATVGTGVMVDGVLSAGAGTSTTDLQYADGSIMMHAGDTLCFIPDPPVVAMALDVAVEWDEEG